MKIGRIVGHGGVCWIEGYDNGTRFETTPGWVGRILGPRRAVRYARRNGIEIAPPHVTERVVRRQSEGVR